MTNNNDRDRDLIVNIQLKMGDIIDGITILDFAAEAMKIVSDKEFEQGNVREAAKLHTQVEKATRFIETLNLSAVIGDPISDMKH